MISEFHASVTYGNYYSWARISSTAIEEEDEKYIYIYMYVCMYIYIYNIYIYIYIYIKYIGTRVFLDRDLDHAHHHALHAVSLIVTEQGP
jgi:hypothetical protein